MTTKPELPLEQRIAAVIRYLQTRDEPSDHVNEMEGMIIGSVEGVHITADTPLDPDQWDEGQPWHTKPKPTS